MPEQDGKRTDFLRTMNHPGDTQPAVKTPMKAVPEKTLSSGNPEIETAAPLYKAATGGRGSGRRNQPPFSRKLLSGSTLLVALVIWGVASHLVGEEPEVRGAAPPPAIAPFDAKTARSHQDAWARHLGIQVETRNSVGQTMILIPPGEFLMGSSDEQVEAALKAAEEIQAESGIKGRIEHAERPQHQVVITKPFLMSATEVTVGQFKQFAAVAGYQTEAEKAAKDATKANTYLAAASDDLPAAYITWNDAAAYCAWLTTQETRPKAPGDLADPSGTGSMRYRLPTEAEWEYACRAGTTTQYSFGDDYHELPKYGWHNQNADGRSHPVGTLLPNPFGLFDMHGNLYEWSGDYFDEKWYEKSFSINTASADPRGPTAGSDRLIRGGTWSQNISYARSATRLNGYSPSRRHPNYGFRCVSEW